MVILSHFLREFTEQLLYHDIQLVQYTVMEDVGHIAHPYFCQSNHMELNIMSIGVNVETSRL